MRALVLKLIMLLFALIGIHTPAVWICAPGHAPGPPSACERVTL